jgi:hypothetical protein
VDFAFLFHDWLGKPAWMWLGLMAIVIVPLTLDLGVLRKATRAIETTERLLLSAGYITLGVAFIAWGMGRDKFPPAWGFSITLGILATGILFSLCRTGRDVAVQPEPSK